MFSLELPVHYLMFMFKNFRTNIYVYQKEYVLKYSYRASHNHGMYLLFRTLTVATMEVPHYTSL